jgi:hypothetical protein
MKLSPAVIAATSVLALVFGLAARGAAAPQGSPSGADSRPLGIAIDGPPPPIPPAVISRDERGRITLRAVRLQQSLVIDGRLDDPVYREVLSIGDFIQQDPNENQPATEETAVWIFFDERNLYVSARCLDSQPDRVLATEMRRDNQGIFNNDQVTVVVDTFYDHRTGFFFQTNPLGGRRDQQINSADSLNIDWNPVWDAKSVRDEHGWTTEMVIPFKSLRFKTSGPQVWGINVRRAVRWKNEWDYLAPIPRSYGSPGLHHMELAATLVGVEVPTQRNLELKPYAISSLTTNNVAQTPVSNDGDGNVGFDAKYGLTRGLIADVTVNTDFAQVEEDSQQVNLTRFSLFFPEKRDFFLEGQGIFAFGPGGSPAPVIFFSRRIGLNEGVPVPIAAGGRVTGRSGRYTIGALNIQTKDSKTASAPATNFSTLRIKRDILRRSTIGMIATSRSRRVAGEGSNQVVGIDMNLGLLENIQAIAYYAKSRTPGVSGHDASYFGGAAYEGDRYGLQAAHFAVEDQFNPELGFLYRPAFRMTTVQARFSPRPAHGQVRKLFYEAFVNYFTDPHGRLESREAEASFQAQFNSGDSWTTRYSRQYELLREDFGIATGVIIPPGGYAFQNLRTQYTFGVQRKVSGAVQLNRGTFYDGTRTSASFSSGRVDLIRQLSIEPGVSLNWVTLPHGQFTASVISTRVTYMLNPRANAGAFIQCNSSSHLLTASARLRWEYVPGSELFVVYSDNRDTLAPGYPALQNRTFAVKITRLVRF